MIIPRKGIVFENGSSGWQERHTTNWRRIRKTGVERTPLQTKFELRKGEKQVKVATARFRER